MARKFPDRATLGSRAAFSRAWIAGIGAKHHGSGPGWGKKPRGSDTRVLENAGKRPGNLVAL